MFDEPTAGMSVDEVPVVLDLIARLKTGREQDHPARRAQDGRRALARRPHHRAAQRPARRGRRARRGDRLADRAGGLSRRRARAGRHERATSRLQGVHTHIGRYHILQGVDFVAPRGRDDDAARAQRRRQDDGAAHDHGAVARLARAGSCSATRRSPRSATPDIARAGVAYVPETMAVFSDLTVQGKSGAGGARRAARRRPARMDFRLFPGADESSGCRAPAGCRAARSRCCRSPARSSSRAACC